ncbi:hypothetical protein L7F22_009924 [Adiantum nelumboides]|nr:hypothetical protein [Adiantum nelumboides]
MASLAITPFAIHKPLASEFKARSFPCTRQPFILSPRIHRNVEASGRSWLRYTKRPPRAHSHVCSSFFVGSSGNDALCTAAGFAGAYAWIRVFNFLGEKDVLEQKLSRKLIHVSTGLLYVLLWPFFRRRETSHEQRSNDAKGKTHVVEQPPASIGHRQPSIHGLVNGQYSNEQNIPMPMSNAGCFGGGSVFEAMIRPSPALHGLMPEKLECLWGNASGQQ